MDNKISGVVFDMDGVLFDTERLGCELWAEVCRENGMHVSIETFKTFAGIASEAAYPMMEDILGRDYDYRAMDYMVYDRMRLYIRDNGTPLKPGLFKTLEFLKNNGYKMAVATSAVEKEAMNTLSAGGVLKYLDGRVFGDTVRNSKPAPDIYLKAAEILGLSPAECIAVEDSPAGLRAAYAAGMLPVMAPDLIEPDEELISIAYAIIYSLDELISLISG